MTFPTPLIGHLRNGLFFTRLDCQSNAKPSENDHDLPGTRIRDLWSSSQHSQRQYQECADTVKKNRVNFVL
jgi:hypothetical protein